MGYELSPSAEGIPIPVAEEVDERLVLLNGTGELTNRHKVCSLRSRTSLQREILGANTSNGNSSNSSNQPSASPSQTRTAAVPNDPSERVEDKARIVQAVDVSDAIVYFGCG